MGNKDDEYDYLFKGKWIFLILKDKCQNCYFESDVIYYIFFSGLKQSTILSANICDLSHI